MTTGVGRVGVADQATQASPGAAKASPPSGEYPSRKERAIIDWYGLRTRETWERAIISLDSARRLARDRYFAKDELGWPWAASCWVHEESGVMKLFVADYPNGRRLVVRFTAGNNVTVTWTETPTLQHQQLAKEAAIATEAGAAETVEQGSVHEGAGPQDIAQTPPGSDQ